MPQTKMGIRRFFTKKAITTVDSKDFTDILPELAAYDFLTEYRPVCIRDHGPIGDWTTDPAEADRIASSHRRQTRHATTVQIRN